MIALPPALEIASSADLVNLLAEIETEALSSPLPIIFTNSFLEDKPFSTNTHLVSSERFLASTNA